jgi:hypothetical protein
VQYYIAKGTEVVIIGSPYIGILLYLSPRVLMVYLSPKVLMAYLSPRVLTDKGLTVRNEFEKNCRLENIPFSADLIPVN